MPQPDRLVLGKTLAGDVAALLNAVEGMYGRSVVFTPWENATIYEGGNCIVQDDGTPGIQINLQHPLWEDAVVHELHHLILRKKQYPSFSLKNDVGSGLKQWHLENIRQMFFELYEPILHHVFNPMIRGMGRNPAVLFNAMYDKYLEPEEVESNTEPLAWPLVYFRILLECDKPEVREQLRHRCEKLGWGEAMVKAESIVAKINGMTEPTPVKAVEVLIHCVNIVFEGVYRLSVIELIDVHKGPQVEKRVRISVSPPGPHL